MLQTQHRYHSIEGFLKLRNAPMPTVKFSVLEYIKAKFNETFKGRNKSAVIADLMCEAIAREQRRRESQEAAQRILERHPSAPMRTAADLDSTRSRI